MFNFNFDKRKLVVLSLVFILISISYLNYMINKQSLLVTSNEFKNYEENQLDNLKEEEENTIVTHGKLNEENKKEGLTNSTDSEETVVIDSHNGEVNDILQTLNDNIERNIISQKSKGEDYFLQAKIDIEMEREKTIERFDEIINNELIDDQSRKNAVDKKISLIETINKEKIIESLIKGKGFEDAIVFITEKSVYVTVSKDELSNSDIAKILDIITRETEVPIDNIKIQRK